MPTSYAVPASASLAMTGQYPPRTFRRLQDCNQAIGALQESFTPAGCRSNRDQLRRASVRLTYFPDIETLLIKVPTAAHATAHRCFTDEAVVSLAAMGISLAERVCTGATTYAAPSHSEKEPDTSYKNSLLRPLDTDWPHFVIESGVPESLPRLRQDVNWWIGNPGGRVLLVLLLKVSRAEKKLTVEKYFPKPRQGPSTRAQAAAGDPDFVPRLISTTVVNMKNSAPPPFRGPRGSSSLAGAYEDTRRDCVTYLDQLARVKDDILLLGWNWLSPNHSAKLEVAHEEA
ncbi:hypothetical protein AOCH_003913, partial [Aspergillus ochraceoroseus]